MKKIILLTMILCALTQSVWGKDCLSKEALQVAKDVGEEPKSMAYTMMAYEGKLHGDMLGLYKEFKRKADAGDFDKDEDYIESREEDYELYLDFFSNMNPDMFDTPNKAAHFKFYFGPKWGKVALKLHDRKGDLLDRLDGTIPANKKLQASIDEQGCVN